MARVIIMNWLRFCLISLLASSIAGANVGLSSEGASEPLPSGGVQTSSSEGASEPLPSGGVSDRGPSEEYESPGIKSDGSWSWLEYFYIKLKTDIEKLINLFSLE